MGILALASLVLIGWFGVATLCGVAIGRGIKGAREREVARWAASVVSLAGARSRPQVLRRR